MNNSLLRDYMNNWFGYGGPDSSFWVIGPEPGGQAEELEKRVRAWYTLGKKFLVDAKSFHSLINEDRWFNPPVTIQPTWKKIIITYLAYHDIPYSDLTIRNVQQRLFGSKKLSGINKLYLSPLASRRMSHWGYDFITREQFYETILPDRISLLKTELKHMSGITVLMIGVSVYDYYHQLLDDNRDVEIHKIGNIETQFQYCNKNKFILSPHPMAHGVPLSYWKSLGDFIRYWDLY